MEIQGFLDRILQRLPTAPPRAFSFLHWNYAGRPTDEVLGILPIAGVQARSVLAAVMDVDNYAANLAHVSFCASIADKRYRPPDAVRFYQRVSLPMLPEIHHELVLRRMGARGGYELAGWDMLVAETDALHGAVRSSYSYGLWLAAPGLLGYAFCSAPRREDIATLTWMALTAGSDRVASMVVRSNIEGMARWAARR